MQCRFHGTWSVHKSSTSRERWYKFERASSRGWRRTRMEKRWFHIFLSKPHELEIYLYHSVLIVIARKQIYKLEFWKFFNKRIQPCGIFTQHWNTPAPFHSIIIICHFISRPKNGEGWKDGERKKASHGIDSIKEKLRKSTFFFLSFLKTSFVISDNISSDARLHNKRKQKRNQFYVIKMFILEGYTTALS